MDTAQSSRRWGLLNFNSDPSEAMGEGGGVLTIRSYARELSQIFIDSFFPDQHLQPREYTILEIGDTGCGMTSDIREKAFTPFYTTKTNRRGLGLSTSLGILKEHAAGIKVYTKPEEGSIMVLYFPSAPNSQDLRPWPDQTDSQEKGMRTPESSSEILLQGA